jgi:phage head maturation protease
VPGGLPHAALKFLDRVEGRQQVAAPAVARRRFLSSDNRELKRPGIQGFACLHDKAFFASGRWRAMKTGAFINTIFDGKPKQLLFEHNPKEVLAESGIEFENCLDGLAFRMPLSASRRPFDIYDAVMDNSKPCLSIGGEVVEHTVIKPQDGVEWDYVSKASLSEISLCYEGAVSGTFAKIVDIDEEEPNLWLACRTTGFTTDKAVANVTARARRISDMLKALVD